MTNYLSCFHCFNPFPTPLPHMQLWFLIEIKAYHNREKKYALIFFDGQETFTLLYIVDSLTDLNQLI